jgi:hypothetical protein
MQLHLQTDQTLVGGRLLSTGHVFLKGAQFRQDPSHCLVCLEKVGKYNQSGRPEDLNQIVLPLQLDFLQVETWVLRKLEEG